MKLIIEIDLSNAAFDPCPNQEISNILMELGQDIMIDGPECKTIRDSNGNTCGKVKINRYA